MVLGNITKYWLLFVVDSSIVVHGTMNAMEVDSAPVTLIIAAVVAVVAGCCTIIIISIVILSIIFFIKFKR